MSGWRISSIIRVGLLLASLAASPLAQASEYHGAVTFGGLPVPGATVTATQGDKKFFAITDQMGVYTFPDLPDGKWTIHIEMSLFAPIEQEVTIVANAAAGAWELKMLSADQIMAKATAVKQTPPVVAAATPPPAKTGAPKSNAVDATKGTMPDIPKPADDSSPRPSDGLLINGTSSNAATSQFSMAAAFGNTRSSKSLYTWGLSAQLDNSATDASPYSLTGLVTPKASYNRFTGGASFGGPLNIPHLMPHGPNFFVGFSWTRNQTDGIGYGLTPTPAEREGDFSGVLNSAGQPLQIFNPATGQPYTSNVPVSPQAAALLNLFPLPNLAGSTRYNYQTAELGQTHQDGMNMRLDKSIGRKNSFWGVYAFQSSRASQESLFGFVDKTDTLGMTATPNWQHRFSPRLIQTVGYSFSRLRSNVLPQFENREDIEGNAGITGYNNVATDWGPPGLNFSNFNGLTDAQSAHNRNETNGLTYSLAWYRGRHNITAGGDFRRQEFNVLSQQDPRGTFSFTGAATQGPVSSTTLGGSDLADFLIGVPDTSSIAYGNADKYLRQTVYDLFLNDDWRARPELTINFGVRWVYGSPIDETKNRLVNLDITNGFGNAASVLASDPVGSLTGEHYPTSLINPDRRDFAPSIGLSWRPIPGSTLVVRGGYGIYYDSSVFLAAALQMAQQEPLSKSLQDANSAACPLTLANGLYQCATSPADTFAVDPHFRTGYAQDWQLSAQRDLPGALVATATYMGIKGTHGVQQYLPNTYPLASTDPCPMCPSGFSYRSTGGNSIRNAGLIQLRRRLRNGLTATVLYTYSKSIDDDSSLGGQGPVSAGVAAQNTVNVATAQNWLNLKGERGLSSFDQRHLLNASLQYTSGMGKGGGSLLSGWRGTLLKEWTVLSTIAAGTGLPETPIYYATTPGSAVSGAIRPDPTGASIHTAKAGYFLNSAAYTAPVAGQWGTAGRNSITGPNQFTLNASLQRTFRLHDHMNLDLRVDSTNLLNHVTFTTYNTTVNSTTFGLPASANAMRSLQTTVRLRY